MSIPWIGYEEEYEELGERIEGAIRRVVRSGSYERGEEVDAFEREFAAYCGVTHGIGTNSCYAAMLLSLLACGVGPGDEVITVPNTDIATTTAIRHTGASFVWTEIDEQTHNMDPARIEEKITSRTKAILPVHLYGLPADMRSIMSIATAHGLKVISDNALAVGARYRGARSAAIGDTGCFSFSYSKGLGTYGDAGMVVTDDPVLADTLRSLEIYNNETLPMDTTGKVAILDRFNYRIEGHYTRLVSIHAAILREKLKVLDFWIARRRNIAQLYKRHLGDLDVTLPFEPSESEHVFRNFPILVKERDRVRRELARGGIPTGVHYAPPLHLQPVYSDLGFGIGSFPATERIAREIVTLPMHPFLSEDHVAHISTALQHCIES